MSWLLSEMCFSVMLLIIISLLLFSRAKNSLWRQENILQLWHCGTETPHRVFTPFSERSRTGLCPNPNPAMLDACIDLWWYFYSFAWITRDKKSSKQLFIFHSTQFYCVMTSPLCCKMTEHSLYLYIFTLILNSASKVRCRKIEDFGNFSYLCRFSWVDFEILTL